MALLRRRNVRIVGNLENLRTYMEFSYAGRFDRQERGMQTRSLPGVDGFFLRIAQCE